MVWDYDKRDELRVSWGRRRLRLDPSHKHIIWKLEGPFCLESRGQLSICLSVCLFLLSLPTGGHDGHSQENREGGLARTVSLNLQRAIER